MIVLPRRKFLTGLAALVAAPAIVKASSLMPVKVYRDMRLDQLDILFSKMYIRSEWRVGVAQLLNYNYDDKVTITPIMSHEFYKNG